MSSITILFGTETGNSESASKELESALHHAGYRAKVTELSAYPAASLPTTSLLLIVTSTYGKGDTPANAEKMLRHLETHPELGALRYGVCALGDSTYQHFAQCGRDYDRVLAECGANRVVDLCVCDVDYEENFPTFQKNVLDWLAENGDEFRGVAETKAKKGFFARLFGFLGRPADAPVEAPVGPLVVRAPSGPKTSFAIVKSRRRLNAEGSAKETMHYELELEDADFSYLPGDCIAVHPDNSPEDVARFLERTGLDGATPVVFDGRPSTLREVLKTRDFHRLTTEFAELLARGQGPLAVSGCDVKAYRHERHVLEALAEHEGFGALEAGAVLEALLPTPARLYSIASSPRVQPKIVAVTVETPRYEHGGYQRVGLASGWLCDRVGDGARIRVHKVLGNHFRPAAPDVDMILIGPGTGVAPYRGFLQERGAQRGAGRTWLFFGHQHEQTDFLYREELEGFREAGVLTRLDCAWSRDQIEKRYVQHLLEEAGQEVWAWVQGGAVLYVCGDKQHMAADVHAALVRVAMRHGGLDTEAAHAFWKDAEENDRYRVDVY